MHAPLNEKMYWYKPIIEITASTTVKAKLIKPFWPESGIQKHSKHSILGGSVDL